MRARGPTIAFVAAALAMGLGPASAQTSTAKPAEHGPKPARPAAAAPAAPAKPAAPGGEPDAAYGAYQRGYYLTAFKEATKRVTEEKNPKSMTMLGELYANGLGVTNDDVEAAKWYALAAERGDREAMFALAMFRIGGRGGQRDLPDATRLLTAAAKLGQPAAAYDLGLLYLEGQQFPQDFKRAAELFQMAAQAGNPEAQYALATLYKDGRGVAQNPQEATRLMGEAAQADFLDAEVEYAIALFNGTGIAKDEVGAAAMFRKAALRGSAIAQNRLARIFAIGRGVPAVDAVQAVKWYLISKAGGDADTFLDDYAQKQSPDVRAAAEKAAKPWLDLIAQSHT